MFSFSKDLSKSSKVGISMSDYLFVPPKCRNCHKSALGLLEPEPIMLLFTLTSDNLWRERFHSMD